MGRIICRLTLFFFIFWNINPLDFENNGACAVIAAGNHHAFIIRPFVHNRSTLQCCINISADSVPCLSAKFTIHQMIKIVSFRGALQKKCITSSLYPSDLFFPKSYHKNDLLERERRKAGTGKTKEENLTDQYQMKVPLFLFVHHICH